MEIQDLMQSLMAGPSEDERKRALNMGLLNAGLAMMGRRNIGDAGLLGLQAGQMELDKMMQHRKANMQTAMMMMQIRKEADKAEALKKFGETWNNALSGGGGNYDAISRPLDVGGQVPTTPLDAGVGAPASREALIRMASGAALNPSLGPSVSNALMKGVELARPLPTMVGNQAVDQSRLRHGDFVDLVKIGESGGGTVTRKGPEGYFTQNIPGSVPAEVERVQAVERAKLAAQLPFQIRQTPMGSQLLDLPADMVLENARNRGRELGLGGAPAVPSGAPSSQPSQTQPAGIPGFNFGNIRPIGASTGFQSFSTPDDGLRAIDQNLQAYGKRGINTLEKIISTWAPPSDNNPTAQLIKNASQRLSLDPKRELDLNNPAVRQMIGSAIMLQEHGPERLFSAISPQSTTGQQQAPSMPQGRIGVTASAEQLSNEAANKEFQVQDAKSRQETYANMQKAALAASGKIAKFERIGSLLKDYEGGKLSNAALEFARLGNSLGVKIDPKLGEKEAAVALSNEAALLARSTADGGGMPGAMSDADREFVRSMIARLDQSIAGRRMVVENAVLISRREQQVAEMARRYKQKYGTVDEGFFSQLQEWSNRNPVFKNANR